MSDSLQFSIRAKGLDGYLDWMTDLTWIEKPEVIIVIYEFKDFLENDLQIKEAIIEDFKKIINLEEIYSGFLNKYKVPNN